MLYMFWQLTVDLDQRIQQLTRIAFTLWVVLLCRVIKYMGHFAHYPEDLKYILLIPFFGYFHSCFIKMYAMITMHVVSVINGTLGLDPSINNREQTTWGSRAGADADDEWRLIRLPGYSAGSSDRRKHDVVEEIDEGYFEEEHALLPKYDDET